MIKRFLVNGSEEKLSKSVLADEISNSLLPEATSEDEGKVISVDATGGYVLSTIESELPAATPEDEGKVVTVSQDGKYELAEASSPLPVPVLPQDVGKAIIVDDNGGYTLAEAGGSDVETVTVYIPYSNVNNIPTTGTIIGYKDTKQTKFTAQDYNRLYSAIKSNSVKFIIMLANETSDNANMIFPTSVLAVDGPYSKYIHVSFLKNGGTFAQLYVTVYNWES